MATSGQEKIQEERKRKGGLTSSVAFPEKVVESHIWAGNWAKLGSGSLFWRKFKHTPCLNWGWIWSQENEKWV